ncbi:hypothetical protein JCM8547_003419 [Rhodosporidiobolus lusitaniae]
MDDPFQHAHDAHIVRSLTRSFERRQLRYFLVLLSLTLLLLARTFSSSSPSSSHATPHTIHPTLVGPRPVSAPSGKALYSSCTADELLGSLAKAVVRPDGASRFPNFTKPESVALPEFEWSFDLAEVEESGKQCAPMKVYSTEEACELVSAFSGIYTTGDSFARHVHSAFLMLLHGRLDGAVTDYLETDDCRGDQLFDDGKGCRERIFADTNTQERVCGGLANLGFVQTYQPNPISFSVFNEWHARLPSRSHLYSPVYITGLGGHFDYTPSTLLSSSYLDTLFSTLSRHFPTPLNLFMGPHAPGENQQPQYNARQGPQRVKAFAEQVPGLLRERSTEKEMGRGGARYVDFFASTEGAKSYDGVHYSYQVNMEKAQVFLNLLDIAWGQIAERGGMVVRG